MAVKNYLQIDTSEAARMIHSIHREFSEDQMNRLLYSAFRRTSGHVRKIMKQDLPVTYHIKRKSWVGNAVRSPSIQVGGRQVNCTIPVVGERGKIGTGQPYTTKGGVAGWRSLKYKGKGYKIRTQMVNGQSTILPKFMVHQGGFPPFRNTTARKLNGLVFTRKTKKPLPIVPVAGLGVPQMPLNRARDDVQHDIEEYLLWRIVHEHDRIMKRLGGK